MNELTGLGVAGCLFILLIREVLSFASRRRSNHHNARNPCDLPKMGKQVDRLDRQIEIDKLNTRAFAGTIERLEDSIQRCTTAIGTLTDVVRSMRQDRLDKCPMYQAQKEGG